MYAIKLKTNQVKYLLVILQHDFFESESPISFKLNQNILDYDMNQFDLIITTSTNNNKSPCIISIDPGHTKNVRQTETILSWY